MLSGVNEYHYNLEPLGIFCLRVTFYFTAETRPGQPISTCGRAGDVIQNVLRLSLARGRRCGRATPVNSEQPAHTFSPKRTICNYSPSKCTFHEHSEENSDNNKHVFGGDCVAFCLCCYCKCGLTFALQAGASGTVLHEFEHHDNMAVPSRRISGPLYPDARDTDLSHVTHVENGTHKSILGRR